MNITQKTLKLLNAVEAKSSKAKNPFVHESGIVIMPEAIWAKDDIISFYQEKNLTPEQLNKTFHKSWKKIQESSRLELLIHQIIHYASTYGTDFCGETYIPFEELNIPEKKIQVFVVQALSKEEIRERLLKTLQSGIAMDQDSLEDTVDVLESSGHKFSTKDNIKNKEANILLADKYGIYPENPSEFLRYCIFKSTEKSLLIKDRETIQAIKDSKFDPSYCFISFGIERLAEVFNRFKPIFLAYKNKCPKIINKISKLSKDLHKPLIQSDLNFATRKLVKNVSGVTTFALLRALSVIHESKSGADGRVFFIRNGKSFVKDDVVSFDRDLLEKNEKTILAELRKRVSSKSVFIPENIDYALPVSTKMFVGDIPMGTKFYCEDKNVAVGVYWKNSWGARDIDLSGVTENGKVGWNARYNQNNELLYSGDMTNASNGATEYLYSDGANFSSTIVMTNIYSGDDDCGYSIVVGNGSGIDKKYMMDPNKVLAHVKTNSVQKQSVLGVIFQDDQSRKVFSIVNVGAGQARVSGNNEYSEIARKVFIQKWSNALTLREVLQKLDFEIADKENCEVDLSLESATKESFINLFENKE